MSDSTGTAYGTASYGTLNLNGISIGVGNLSGGGGKIINNSSGSAATLTIGNSNASGGIFGGVIVDGSSTVALTKVGTGTITLSGTNTYSGGTTISNGVFQLGDGLTAKGSINGNITNFGTLIIARPAASTEPPPRGGGNRNHARSLHVWLKNFCRE